MSPLRVLVPLLLASLLSACEPNIVGAPISSPDAGVDRDYPPGPYGLEPGEVLQNMQFAGYVNASPDEGIASAGDYLGSVSMQDVRALGYRLMLINVAAVWCVPCRDEARVLPEEFKKWAPKGGLVISVLTEDEQFNPATKDILDSWASAFSINYTMLHDPQGQVATLIAPGVMPVNIMVEVDTMQIVRIRYGDDPEFFPFFENRLQ